MGGRRFLVARAGGGRRCILRLRRVEWFGARLEAFLRDSGCCDHGVCFSGCLFGLNGGLGQVPRLDCAEVVIEEVQQHINFEARGRFDWEPISDNAWRESMRLSESDGDDEHFLHAIHLTNLPFYVFCVSSYFL